MESRATLDEACRTLAAEPQALGPRRHGAEPRRVPPPAGQDGDAPGPSSTRRSTTASRSPSPRPSRTAKRQRDELAAMLSTLTVTVPPATAALEGLTVEVDGSTVAARALEHRLRDRPRARPGHGPRPGATSPSTRRWRSARTRTRRPSWWRSRSSRRPRLLRPLLRRRSPSHRQAVAPVWPWVVGGAGVALGAAAIGSEVVSLSAHEELDDELRSRPVNRARRRPVRLQRRAHPRAGSASGSSSGWGPAGSWPSAPRGWGSASPRARRRAARASSCRRRASPSGRRSDKVVA